MFKIGLGHISRTGKDTCANILFKELMKRNYKVSIISFASLLKKECVWYYGELYGVKDEAYYNINPQERNKVIEGLDKTVVQLWIDWGMGRRMENPDYWVNALLNQCSDEDYVIVPDLRFNNEWRIFDAHIRVDRKGCQAVTEPDKQLVGREDWDYIIQNNGTMSDLEGEIKYLIPRLITGSEAL